MYSKSSKGSLTKEEIAKLNVVIDKLESNPIAYDFLLPVDYIGK
jgi:hypothetical protein